MTMIRSPILAINSINEEQKIYHCFCPNTKKSVPVQLKICTGEEPKVGSYLVYDPSAVMVTQNNFTHIINSQVVPPEDYDYVKFDEDGSPTYNVWIGFSNTPEHSTYNRKTGYTEKFGFLDTSDFTWRQNHRAFKAYVKVKPNLTWRSDIWTQPFEIVKFGKALDRPKDKADVSKFLEEMDRIEEELFIKNGGTRPESDTAEEKENLENLRREITKSTGSTSTCSSVHTDASTIDHPIFPRILSNRRQESSSPNDESVGFKTEQRPKVTGPQYLERNAVVMIEEEHRFIVYLFDHKMAATYWKYDMQNSQFKGVALGASFQCLYQTEKDHVAANVTTIVKAIPNQHQLEPIDGKNLSIRLIVDLYEESTEFEDFYEGNGAPIVKLYKKEDSKNPLKVNRDFVMLSEMVRGTDQKLRTSWDTLKCYSQQKKFRYFYSKCRLELKSVPRAMVEDAEAEGMVKRYVWTVYELEGEKVFVDGGRK